jgi:hypothetical protein
MGSTSASDFLPRGGGAGERPRAGRPKDLAPRHAGSLRMSVIGAAQVLVAGAIIGGWAIRQDRWLIPQEGAGYLLGIVGLGLMVLLLLYPIRKRLRVVRAWGRLGAWFQIHMLLGLIGPLAILYHANFRLGSLNANIALVCMLAVAASGVVGRVIYVRIHEGLSGRRKTLVGLRDALEETRSLAAAESRGARLLDELADFERGVLGGGRDETPGALVLLTLPWRWRSTRRRTYKLLRAGDIGRDPAMQKRGRRSIARFIRSVRSVAVFTAYERLFALWHVAHLPLCFLLFASAAVHVVAVHMY